MSHPAVTLYDGFMSKAHARNKIAGKSDIP